MSDKIVSRELDILEKLEKELNLKELQIKSLLTITQAINDNVAAEGLFNMYRSFLSWEMGIDKMILFIRDENEWSGASNINVSPDNEEELIELVKPFKRLHTIKTDDDKRLKEFDIVIPVSHKKYPIAYALIGGLKDKEDIYNRIQFITTITNIIAVAIENKRLFKHQIRQERFKKELELAQDFQKMLIPENIPKGEKFEIKTIYRPHYNVGGDYIDFIKFDEHKFALVIADISGKGVAAALLMANFQAMLQSLIFQYRDLETFVFALNQAVFRITKSDKFITFFICEINTDKKQLKYINAGHYPPLFLKDGELFELKSGSTVIGAFEKLPFINEEIMTWSNEAMIMCFTDGLPELQNGGGDFFGAERIHSLMFKNAHLSANDFNEKLIEDIEKFRGNEEYLDDIAVLTGKLY